ncbi:5-hydroxytryptamine receptor 1B-like [Paramacrobiotus metropolitanus]|uniref:5-hydroxytryptamine receptor 1B-like n=1 Tax=Paramacrobiotus metropolitanus TaxID=2943436 RepID=UPI002445D754|nr:5-hydroxytryptamine receptor 1B-like [Paramacrobiotus metropolitanus]
MTVVSIGLNAGVIIYHIIRPKQITPFTTYLVALYIANLVFLFTTWPLSLLREWNGKWIMRSPVCIFNLYATKVFCVVPVPLHVLIAVNRWWAIQHPISYRSRHNKVVAACLCFVAFFWAHTFAMAGFIVEVLYYYRPEVNPECRLFYGM